GGKKVGGPEIVDAFARRLLGAETGAGGGDGRLAFVGDAQAIGERERRSAIGRGGGRGRGGGLGGRRGGGDASGEEGTDRPGEPKTTAGWALRRVHPDSPRFRSRIPRWRQQVTDDPRGFRPKDSIGRVSRVPLGCLG